MRLLACLIVAPQRGYDEPAILSYAISSFCPTSADGLQGVDVEAKAPMAVDHGRGRRFLHDGPFRAGHDVASCDAVDIGRDRDHTVGIVTSEVGIDTANSNCVR